MPLDCEGTREQIDAWALGALDADELAEMETHLGNCAMCTRLAEDARETAAAVALGVPLRIGSATLRSRVMASARALSDVEHAGAPRWWRYAAGAAAVLAIAAIAWGTAMQIRASDLDGDRSALAAAATAQAADLRLLRTQVAHEAATRADLDTAIESQNEVLEILMRPGLQWTSLSGTAAAPGAKAVCAWSRAEAVGAVLASGLPHAPAGTAYVFWIAYENRWLSGGTFADDGGGRGRLVVRRVWGQEDIGRFVGYAVTLEDAGTDATRPSGEVVLASANLP